MTKFKILSIISSIVAVVAIAALIYVVLSKNPTTEVTEQPNNTNTAEEQPRPDQTYTNAVNGFSFQYPNDLKVGDTESTYLPDGTNKEVLVESSLSHEINAEYCAPSGKCEPTTEDFHLNIVVIPSPLSDIQKSLGGSAVPLEHKQFGTTDAIALTMGVEGEGRNYYFIALPNNKTLMLEQAYIDENVLVNYKSELDFITFAKQNQITTDIINSLEFLN